MKYLIDKNYNVICSADDDFEFMLNATANDYPGSIVISYIPKKPIPMDQPPTTGTQTI
jgi:hypothetical protein